MALASVILYLALAALVLRTSAIQALVLPGMMATVLTLSAIAVLARIVAAWVPVRRPADRLRIPPYLA